MKTLLFIPAYNEQDTVSEVINDHRNALEKLGKTCDVLVVDDGSSDNTADTARAVGAIVIKHQINRGLGEAFQSGVSYATANKYDVMITVDADGQFSSSNLQQLLIPLFSNEADLVTGSRFLPKSKIENMPRIKKWGNHVMSYLVSSLAKRKFLDVSCGFRAYNREAILRLNLFGSFTYTHEVILNLLNKGIRMKEIPVSVTYSKDRKSRIANNLLKYAWKTVSIILSSTITYRPLRLFGIISALLWTIGVPVLLILGIRYVLTGMITPFKGIAITALIICIIGAISISAGIILDVIRKLQMTSDEILYYQKKK